MQLLRSAVKLEVLVVEERQQSGVAAVRKDDAIHLVFGQLFLGELSAFATADRSQGSGLRTRKQNALFTIAGPKTEIERAFDWINKFIPLYEFRAGQERFFVFTRDHVRVRELSHERLQVHAGPRHADILDLAQLCAFLSFHTNDSVVHLDFFLLRRACRGSQLDQHQHNWNDQIDELHLPNLKSLVSKKRSGDHRRSEQN